MKHIAYYRVSTRKQGQSGLGLEAQQRAVRDCIDSPPIAEFTEVESGRKADRPKLLEALKLCRLTGATLVVAKLDRLSRNAAFLNALLDSGQKVMFADMPDADQMVIGIMAQLAQWEAKQISKRTTEALRAAKDRGRTLGGSYVPSPSQARTGRNRSIATRVAKAAERKADLMPILDEARSLGITSLTGLAEHLNERHITTARGGRWVAASVRRLIG